MASMLWQPGAGRNVLVGVGVLVASGLIIAISALADDEVGRFAGAFTNLAPIVLLAVLGQLQPVWPALRPLTWGIFALLLLIGLALVVAATALPLTVAPDVSTAGNAGPPLDTFKAPVLALALGSCGLAGAVALFIGGAWVRVARRLGGQVDPADLRHAQALVGLVAALALPFVPTIALGGEAPALRAAAVDPDFFTRDRSVGGQLLDLVYDLTWTIPLALLLVGVPMQRSLRAALTRLGIRPIGLRGIGVGIGAATVLWVVGTALDQATGWLWTTMGWPATDPELVDRLMGAALSPLGAVVAATSAGLGEELMMRGVLQPRFGWLLPNLAFMAAHALQYNLDALVGVFVLGALLALVRARWSTSEAIVAHGIYDLVLFLGSSSVG